MKIGGICLTERCNLSCVMCHFNGPNIIRKHRTLLPNQVFKFIDGISQNEKDVYISGLGEPLLDENLNDYIKYVIDKGFVPNLLTNGQLLTVERIDSILKIGMRKIRISVDSIDENEYNTIRKGGDFNKILRACSYLKLKKDVYPDIHVEINITLLEKSSTKEEEYIQFWTNKVDRLNFNAEYFDIFKFRNLHLPPPAIRVPCEISVYLLPSGQMAPCCAIMVYQHFKDLLWLPHIDETIPEEAYEIFNRMYHDPTSEFSKICKNCEWWLLSVPHNSDGITPYLKTVGL